MPGRSSSRRSRRAARTPDGRLRLLAVGFVVALAVLAGRAALLSASSSGLSAMADQQNQRTAQLPAHRGSIYDRAGELLAVGEDRQTIYATPSMLTDPMKAAERLGRVLKIKPSKLYRALSDRKSGFAYVERMADPKLARAALALKIPGVGSYPEELRVYPLHSVAAQVLGFVGTDKTGLDGLELSLDKVLRGRPGSETVVQDLNGRVLRTERAKEPVDGKDVHLTIDADIQFRAEQVLRHTLSTFHAKSAVAIVMDPRDGSILALANAPTLDANKYASYADLASDRAVTDTAEPGSIFKVMTVSAALQSKVVTPSWGAWLPPTLQIDDKVIHEAEPRGTEYFTVRRILVDSSNVGAATLGMKLGETRLKEWIKKFGFGKPTGVDLPGEASGIMPGYWSLATTGNVPMGQGISVTALQMARAYCAVANGGILLKPRLVSQIGDEVIPADKGHRILSPTVSREVLSMMVDVVKEGTGVEAQIPGYQVAGKTGTAQMADPVHGGYMKQYVASFIAVVPASHPQLVVLVMVNQPSPIIWGGSVAAPAARDIAQFALQHLKIAP